MDSPTPYEAVMQAALANIEAQGAANSERRKRAASDSRVIFLTAVSKACDQPITEDGWAGAVQMFASFGSQQSLRKLRAGALIRARRCRLAGHRMAHDLTDAARIRRSEKHIAVHRTNMLRLDCTLADLAGLELAQVA